MLRMSHATLTIISALWLDWYPVNFSLTLLEAEGEEVVGEWEEGVSGRNDWKGRKKARTHYSSTLDLLTTGRFCYEQLLCKWRV